MAHTEGLSDEIMNVVADQIGALVPGVIEPERLPAAKITTDKSPFKLWVLGEDALLEPISDLSQLANFTGRWHHQVWVGETAQSFARSAPRGPAPESWRVLEFFESELAEKIHAASVRVDSDPNVKGDPLVHLLEVPSYQVCAFWLVYGEGKDKVVVVDCPESFTHLRPEQLMSPQDFIEALRKEQHTVGRTLT